MMCKVFVEHGYFQNVHFYLYIKQNNWAFASTMQDIMYVRVLEDYLGHPISRTVSVLVLFIMLFV